MPVTGPYPFVLPLTLPLRAEGDYIIDGHGRVLAQVNPELHFSFDDDQAIAVAFVEIDRTARTLLASIDNHVANGSPIDPAAVCAVRAALGGAS